MTLSRTNIVLAVLLVIVVLMTAISGVDYSQPNIEILPDMKYTPAWTAFAANPNFPNGRTLQEPVPGTIPRGELPLYYEATKEDALRAGEELINPYDLSEFETDAATEEVTEEPEPVPEEPATADEDEDADGDEAAAVAKEPDNTAAAKVELSEEEKREAAARERLRASVQRGGGIYRTFCVSCHGPQGAGDGLVTQRGFPPPPSMLTGKSLQMKDGQLFHILTYGQGSMAPLAAQLSRDQRWDAINYVRDLQSKAPPPPAVPPAEPVESPSEVPAEEAPSDEPASDSDETDASAPPKDEDDTPRNPLRRSDTSEQEPT